MHNLEDITFNGVLAVQSKRRFVAKAILKVFQLRYCNISLEWQIYLNTGLYFRLERGPWDITRWDSVLQVNLWNQTLLPFLCMYRKKRCMNWLLNSAFNCERRVCSEFLIRVCILYMPFCILKEKQGNFSHVVGNQNQVVRTREWTVYTEQYVHLYTMYYYFAKCVNFQNIVPIKAKCV